MTEVLRILQYFMAPSFKLEEEEKKTDRRVFDSLKVSSTILSVVCERNNLTVQIDWKTHGSAKIHCAQRVHF